jgi:hypothetical protein
MYTSPSNATLLQDRAVQSYGIPAVENRGKIGEVLPWKAFQGGD